MCLMLLGCLLTFKTIGLIGLIRTSARVGEGLWIDRCSFGCWGQETAMCLGTPSNGNMHKAFSLVNVPITCQAADSLCLRHRHGQGRTGGGRVRGLF